MDKLDNENKQLLNFPCEFAIKVFGVASDEYEVEVITIIRKHSPELREDAIRSRLSKDGKYQALTITVHAVSKEQLDDIYNELSTNSHVLMAL